MNEITATPKSLTELYDMRRKYEKELNNKPDDRTTKHILETVNDEISRVRKFNLENEGKPK